MLAEQRPLARQWLYVDAASVKGRLSAVDRQRGRPPQSLDQSELGVDDGLSGQWRGGRPGSGEADSGTDPGGAPAPSQLRSAHGPLHQPLPHSTLHCWAALYTALHCSCYPAPLSATYASRPPSPMDQSS